MKCKTFISSIFVLFLTGCNSQKNGSTHPCGGRYGSEKVIYDIQQRYNLKNANIVFSEWYKEPVQLPHNCDTIHLYLDAVAIPLVLEDSFAVSVGKLFFSDPLNSSVKFFHLEGIDRWPGIGQVHIKYLLSKKDIEEFKYVPAIATDSSSEQSYEVIQESTSIGSKNKGFNIVVKLTKDVRDPIRVANIIKNRYDDISKGREFNQFTLEKRVTKPFCKLCVSKTYEFLFSKANKNF